MAGCIHLLQLCSILAFANRPAVDLPLSVAVSVAVSATVIATVNVTANYRDCLQHTYRRRVGHQRLQCALQSLRQTLLAACQLANIHTSSVLVYSSLTARRLPPTSIFSPAAGASGCVCGRSPHRTVPWGRAGRDTATHRRAGIGEG